MSDEAPRDFFDKLFGWRKRAPDTARTGAPAPEPPIPEPVPLPPEFVPATELIPDAEPEPAEAAEVAEALEEAREEFGTAEPAPIPVAEPAPSPIPEPTPMPVQADVKPVPAPPPPQASIIRAESAVPTIAPDLSASPSAAPKTSAPAASAPRLSWLQRLTGGLRRSSDQLSGNIAAVFTKARLDEQTLYDLEDVLVGADLGIETALAITEALRRERFDRNVTGDDVRRVLAREVAAVLQPIAKPLVIDPARKPFVILMIGVNGSGKTTTIGKLAQKFAEEGRSVMLAAGDTFRAAAIEQLQVWGQRTGAPVIAKPAGSDASGLAFEAVAQAKAEGRDILIIDTAGRLQNRAELMGELEKIIRVIKKVDPTAPHATLLTLDATTGQNALNQVEIFRQKAGVTGLVMTKLDGTARGGILVAISRKFGLPVHFIGVGEGVDDLEAFEAGDFAAAIAGGTSRTQ